MKIALVLPAAPGYSESFFNSKIRGLKERGYTITLFVNANKNSLKGNGIYYAPDFSAHPLKIIFKIIPPLLRLCFFHFRVLRKFYILEKEDQVSFKKRIKHILINSHILMRKCDHLHFGFGTMALGSENVAAALGAKMEVSFRGFDIGIYPLKHPGCYNLLWKKVDKIHVISDDIFQLVKYHGFKAEEKIFKITPAIDTVFFSSKKRSDENKTLQILCIARLHWKKGLEHTLKALSILKKNGIPFHFTLAGEGSEKARLQFAAYQLQIMDEVSFAGKLDRETLKQKYQHSDLYLQYSIQEGFCNAVLEAQSMGMICIVSDAEGLPENVIHEQTGFVVPKGHPELLAARIMETIALPVERKEALRKNAIERVDRHFNIEKQIDAWEAFYN